MSRYQFDEVVVSPRKVSTVTHDEKTETAFLSGGMTFPLVRDQTRIPGVVIVTALFQKDSSLYILDVFHYEQYDSRLAFFFQSVYDRFKFNDYAIPRKEADPELTRFYTEMEKRRYFNEDKTYPRLIPVPESEFLNFEPVFYLMPDRLHYRRDLDLNVGSLIDGANFKNSQSMPEICALTVAAAFALNRGWQAFELDHIDRLQSKPQEDFF